MAWDRKDWNQIARELSSGEDSDEHDTLNLQSVRRNAHAVASLIHGVIPGLDASYMQTPPKGMNRVDFIRDGLVAAMRESVPRSRGPRPAEGGGMAGGEGTGGTRDAAVRADPPAAGVGAVPSTNTASKKDVETGVLV